MNVLILHNLYQRPGGEDVVVSNEARLLLDAGHQVTVETVDNHAIRGLAAKVGTTLQMGYNSARRVWMGERLERTRPDVVHVHNFFPLLTPAVHAEARSRRVPVVQTLHNYRLFCAAATFERSGEVCELCLHGTRMNALVHRCYRHSMIGSAAVATMQYRAIDRRLLTGNVDRFIALTEFARAKFIEGGIAPDQVVVKPNFLDRPQRPPDQQRSGALFVGRASKEKGVHVLVQAWRAVPDIPLTIIGDGPLLPELRAAAPANVTFLGRQERAAVERAMREAAILIVPSVWYEGFPMILVEAFANGLPAIVSNLGSLAEIVDDGETGFHCTPGDERSIVHAVTRAFADPQELKRMGAQARQAFEEKYSAPRNLQMLEAIYEGAIRAGRHPG